ncbi:MAG: OadG family protein [Lachnospiraceae bacterium]|nr:OadG family protein [Lachnospiraceae bacterium]
MKALLLASIVAASAMASVSFAEQVTEAATESVAEVAAEEVSTEAAAETEPAQAVMEPTEVTGEGKYAMYYTQMEQMAAGTMQVLSDMPAEEVQAKIDDEFTDAMSRAIYANWQTVQEELGSFVEVNEYAIEEEGATVKAICNASYDGVREGTVVTVEMSVNMVDQSTAFAWNIEKPKSQLFQEAGLNTLLGLGTVFVVLVFLSFLIGQIHWVPDLLEKKKKAAAPAAPAAAPAPVAAPVVEEEEYTDDTELVAVIAAAIAAAEGTSTDGFVVRSIRKVNRKNWQNA